MPRPGNVYKKCKDCRRTRSELGYISNRGLCEECAVERQTKSAVQLVAQQGEYYERWLASMDRVHREIVVPAQSRQ